MSITFHVDTKSDRPREGDIHDVFEDCFPESLTYKCPCPSGHDHGYHDEIQYDDYVTNRMIWCHVNGGRYFICTNCKPIINSPTSFTYPILKVQSVVNRQIYTYNWTNQLYDKYFAQFLQVNYYSEAKETFVKQIGLRVKRITCEDKCGVCYICDDKCSDEDYEVDYEFEDPKNDIQWEFAVECDSYNTEDVKLPIDMAHDGIRIYCKCICERCGVESYPSYWGD